jgi:hypothetical protein
MLKTVEWETNVLWSDESRVTVCQSDGRIWVWQMPPAPMHTNCEVCWGCFSWFGPLSSRESEILTLQHTVTF